MNGFLPFDKEVEALRISSNNGHPNSYATNSFPSSSSNPYPDFPSPSPTNQYATNMDLGAPVHHQQSPMARQGSWPGLFSPNNPQMAHQMPAPPMAHQHQQQFNQQWNPQVPNQSYPNPMRGMPMHPNGSMPFMSPPVMQDAIHKQEEEVLVRTLVHATSHGITFKHALNSLHGSNNHPANMWKDHYLEHKYRLDDLIGSYLRRRPPPPTLKKPTLDAFKAEPKLEASVSPILSGRPQQKGQSRKSSTPSSAHGPPPTGRRHTINSLTVHPPTFHRGLPAPLADLKVPEPPSRSPTPPTIIVPKGRGNKFTDQDKTFFLKFISRRLKEDPSLTRNDLCEKLAEKAPHHSTQSWGSYWSNNHDLPDKILAAAKGEAPEEDDDDSESEEEVKITPRRRRPRYKEVTSDEDDADESSKGGDEDADGDEDDGEDDDDDEDDDSPLPSFDESAMGPKGGPFTEADFAITARHIATFPDFSVPTAQEKWGPYSEKYPQRSPKSWAEYYRRNENGLEKLARKIRRLNPPSSATKRKFQDDDEADDKESKHVKVSS